MNPLRFKQISGMAVLLAFVAGVALFAPFAFDSRKATPPSAPAETCVRVPSNIKVIGPPLTVSQVESLSLEKMKGTPTAPQVPFGYSNA